MEKDLNDLLDEFEIDEIHNGIYYDDEFPFQDVSVELFAELEIRINQH